MGIVALIVQPLVAVAVTVYVVAVAGLALTEEPVVAFNPVAGDQPKVVPPPEDAVSASGVPQYTALTGCRASTGPGRAVTTTVVDVLPPQASATVR